jgi:hypothetical protein
MIRDLFYYGSVAIMLLQIICVVFLGQSRAQREEAQEAGYV